jgi:hypothetical protein
MVNCNVVLFNFFPLIEAVQSGIKQSAMGLDDEQSIQTQPYRRIVGESRGVICRPLCIAAPITLLC